MPTVKKSRSYRDRAVTVYFDNAREKERFVKRAESLGLPVSMVALLLIEKAVSLGMIDDMRKAMGLDDDASVQKPRPVVKSKALSQVSRTKKS